MGLNCNTAYNLQTDVALFLEKSGVFYLLLHNPFKSLIFGGRQWLVSHQHHGWRLMVDPHPLLVKVVVTIIPLY